MYKYSWPLQIRQTTYTNRINYKFLLGRIMTYLKNFFIFITIIDCAWISAMKPSNDPKNGQSKKLPALLNNQKTFSFPNVEYGTILIATNNEITTIIAPETKPVSTFTYKGMNMKDLFQPNKIGKTPIHDIARNYDFADEVYYTERNYSSVFYGDTRCKKNDHSQIQQLTKEHLTTTMLNAKDSKGNTVFNNFLKNKTLFCNSTTAANLINTLLSKNADIAIKDKKGNTPLHSLMKMITRVEGKLTKVDSANNCITLGWSSIDIPNLSKLLEIKNNNDQTPLAYSFSHNHFISPKKIAMRLMSNFSSSTCEEWKGIDFLIKKSYFLRDYYGKHTKSSPLNANPEYQNIGSLFLPESNIYKIDTSLLSIQTKLNKFYQEELSSITVPLLEAKQYFDAKPYCTPKDRQKMFTLLLSINACKNFPKVPRVIKEGCIYNRLLSNPLSDQLDIIIGKIENNEKFSKEDLKSFVNEAYDFKDIKRDRRNKK